MGYNISIQTMFTPYDKSHLRTICEGGLAHAFEGLGMITVTTNKTEGYVRHIGWDDHVW